MLKHTNLDKIQQLRLTGMYHALEEQLQYSNNVEELHFDERLSLLLDREITEKENKRLKTRLKKAKLKQAAYAENIDLKHQRGLDNSVVMNLLSCKWLREHNNILFIGPTGTGKTYLACALAHKACLEGFSAQYLRLPKLFEELLVAKGDGRYVKVMSQFAKIDLLILDDLGLNKFNDEQCRELLEILDDRHNLKSTIVTSQLPLKSWHETINEPTFADAILDRLVHNAYRIELKGESLRKKMSPFIDNNLTNTTKEQDN